jgi:cysteine desulfurase/selenocysteine lyase
MTDWAAVRRAYPALDGRSYLDTACKGIPSPAAVRAVEEHLALLRDSPGPSTTDETVRMLEQFDRVRAAAAALINATPEEIALVPSTEAGLAAVASALPLEPGTNVVASDLEFGGTLLPWRFSGAELRLLPHRDGTIGIDDLDAAIDARTRAVVISSVQEVNGFRVDLDALSRLCGERSVPLVVDGIQHVGPLPLDVAATPVGALAVGGHKWLCAPFGMGFLYVSRALSETLQPRARSFMTALPPEGGWSRYLADPQRHPADEMRFPDDARKLELGALGTTLAAAGLAAALETLNALGTHAIAARSAELVRTTVAALRDAGAGIVTPQTEQPSSIVTFRVAADDRPLVEELANAGILTSLRFTTGVGGIRVSPYFYNDENDVDRLAEIVRLRANVRA